MSAHDLTFAYDGAPVLASVSFAVHAGEMVVILGPNGGGKSTLVKLILGLLEPGRGELRVFGQRPRAARSRVGYVPQHSRFDARFPITVFEVVLTGRTRPVLGHHSRADRVAVRDAMEQVGIGDLRARSLSELSGGQRQRVLIARALVAQPELLLLDEPTASVDAFMSDRFVELIARIAAERTVLIVTHDTGYVSAHADRVFCVNRTLTEHPVEVLGTDLMHEVYGQPVQRVRHEAALDPIRSG